MSANRGESWPGGYIRKDASGKSFYWIRRKVGGIRFEVSSRCTQLRPALAELEKFEKDPVGYRGGGASDAPVRLDADLAASYLEHSEERGTTLEWQRQQRSFLAWWSDALHNVDLRRASLKAHILPPLEKVKNRRKRIAVLKHLYSWLRTVQHKVATAEDPTFGALQAEQVRPEQWTRRKAISRADFEKVLKKIDGDWRDPLELLGATGWHLTELVRFARAGEIESFFGQQGKGAEKIAAVLLVPLHKSGAPHRTAVDKKGLAVAKRVRARKGLSLAWFHRAVFAACDKAKVKRFGPGQMRHSVATWAVELGAPIEAVSSFLGHRSMATTKRFYATHAVAPRVRLVR